MTQDQSLEYYRARMEDLITILARVNSLAPHAVAAAVETCELTTLPVPLPSECWACHRVDL